MTADQDVFALLQKTAALPVISLLIASGMYILNDLVDADLDRANGKNRPIPSGRVSRRQAWFFVLATNGVAIVLSTLTFSMISMWIVLPMLLIGVMYSAPRIALMNRFIAKTLSIAIFYALCALLGITSNYGIESAIENPVVPMFSMALLGIMIFISSTLNDLGDVAGDRAANRRTIPVVIGPAKTISSLLVLASAMVAISLIMYLFVGAFFAGMTTAFALVVISSLTKIAAGHARMDVEAVRKQHKRIFPLHIILQLLLASSAVFST
jgi:4-hydroxybenzoate polyprenyltransferase